MMMMILLLLLLLLLLLSPSDHVTFFLSYKILAIYNDVLDDFLKIFNHFSKLEGGKGRGGRITFDENK